MLKRRVFTLLLSLIVSIHLYADSVLVNIENDIINGTDGHLTNSFDASYMMDLETSYFDYFAFKLLHDIYTPNDTQSHNVKDYDIPYAGHLSGEFQLYKVFKNSFYSLRVNFGTIGKYSFAKEVQSNMHRLINNSVPNGWNNQISKDFTFGAAALFAYKTSKQKFLFNEIELNTHLYVNAGNDLRVASIGTLLRYGRNYPDNFEIIDQNNASQLNLPQKFSDFAWSISAGAFLNYYDYIFIFDAYKEKYNINRDKDFIGGVAYFDLYYDTSKVSLSLKTLTFGFNEKSIQEGWIGLSYLYAF